MRDTTKCDDCLEGAASQQPIVECVAGRPDRRVFLEYFHASRLLARAQRDREPVHQRVRAGQSKLGEKALRLLSRVTDERAPRERQALCRTGVRRDPQHSGSAIEAAAVKNGTERVQNVVSSPTATW